MRLPRRATPSSQWHGINYECDNDINLAITRQKQIKAGSRQDKIDLINIVNPEWKDLSKEFWSEVWAQIHRERNEQKLWKLFNSNSAFHFSFNFLSIAFRECTWTFFSPGVCWFIYADGSANIRCESSLAHGFTLLRTQWYPVCVSSVWTVSLSNPD